MEAWRVQHNLGHFFATPYTRFIVCLGIFSSSAWLQVVVAGGGAGGQLCTLHTPHSPRPATTRMNQYSIIEHLWILLDQGSATAGTKLCCNTL